MFLLRHKNSLQQLMLYSLFLLFLKGKNAIQQKGIIFGSKLIKLL